MFNDRTEAAERLAECLQLWDASSALVLAVPRGGVPLARVIARRLKAELDLVLVRKIGAPGHPEYAIGAVDETGRVIITAPLEQLGISRDYVDAAAAEQRRVIARRRALYARPPADPEGRITIVVDDGVATGATLRSALELVREHRPARLIAAVAVAPPAAVERLREVADDVVVLDTPANFRSVGQFYRSFPDISDEEVRRALTDVRRAAALH